MPWGLFDGNLSVAVCSQSCCWPPHFPFLSSPPLLDGCCETPFAPGGEAANFGCVLCAFGLVGSLAPGQGFLVKLGFSSPPTFRPPFFRFALGLEHLSGFACAPFGFLACFSWLDWLCGTPGGFAPCALAPLHQLNVVSANCTALATPWLASTRSLGRVFGCCATTRILHPFWVGCFSIPSAMSVDQPTSAPMRPLPGDRQSSRPANWCASSPVVIGCTRLLLARLPATSTCI